MNSLVLPVWDPDALAEFARTEGASELHVRVRALVHNGWLFKVIRDNLHKGVRKLVLHVKLENMPEGAPRFLRWALRRRGPIEVVLQQDTCRFGRALPCPLEAAKVREATRWAAHSKSLVVFQGAELHPDTCLWDALVALRLFLRHFTARAEEEIAGEITSFLVAH